MSAAPREAFVVSHTHWDREWYLPFSTFRVNLVEVVGRVLDALEHAPEFTRFVLDGQTAVLEDYLEAVPGDRERVAQLVRRGALAVGPWYVLPDEFLVSGEATVRNLLFGSRLGTELGGVQDAGYMPDSFGHPAQTPQILRLAGLDSFIFTRGLGDEAATLGWLFRWEAPDGSAVLAVNQADGYCNAAGLGLAEIWHAHTRRAVDPELAVAKVRDLFAAMAARPGAEPALLNNGCDHFPPQPEFAAVLAALRAAWPDTTFTPGRFEDFLAAARAHTPDEARPAHRGELLGGRDHNILSGVWSARMPLKQRNETCQGLLARVCEPLLAAAALHHGDRWPRGLLRLAWRDLLRNHPHDSICGCSIDPVHREMETRFDRCEQTARQLLVRLLDRQSPTFARKEEDDRTTVIDVANPLPWRRDCVVERLVVLQPLDYDLKNLRVVDDTGRPVPFRITERRFLERFWGIDYRSELWAADQQRLLDDYLEPFAERFVGTEADKDVRDCYLSLQILARDLPPVGIARYRLVDEPGPVAENFSAVKAHLEGSAAVLENNHLRICLYGDGTFDLEEPASGRCWSGLGRLEDAADIGDEYDSCAAPEPGLVSSADAAGNVRLVSASHLRAVAEATFVLDLPEELAADRRRRGPRTVRCPVTVRVTLSAGCRRVNVETLLDNRARDHRLQAIFPTGIRAATVTSDGHFGLETRPLERTGGDDWTQPAPREWPQQDFSCVHDGEAGLAVLNRGLPEFRTRALKDGTVEYRLTLLRSVGWLSRDDFPSRNRSNAGPTLATPDAQCLGRQRFRYALVPFTGDPVAAGLKDESEAWRTPPVTHQGTADQARASDLFLVEKTRPEVAVTAIKLAEADRKLVVRLVNLADVPLVEDLNLGLTVLAARKTGLLEQDLPVARAVVAVADGGRRVHVPLAPHEIATVLLTLAEDEEDGS